MKKLSKIIALLLAGAMAMLMFTACSGGGGSEDKEAEEKVMSQIRGKSTSTASLQNDKDLQKVAAAHLDEDLKGGISIFGHKLVGKVHVEGIPDHHCDRKLHLHGYAAQCHPDRDLQEGID